MNMDTLSHRAAAGTLKPDPKRRIMGFGSVGGGGVSSVSSVVRYLDQSFFCLLIVADRILTSETYPIENCLLLINTGGHLFA